MMFLAKISRLNEFDIVFLTLSKFRWQSSFIRDVRICRDKQKELVKWHSKVFFSKH